MNSYPATQQPTQQQNDQLAYDQQLQAQMQMMRSAPNQAYSGHTSIDFVGDYPDDGQRMRFPSLVELRYKSIPAKLVPFCTPTAWSEIRGLSEQRKNTENLLLLGEIGVCFCFCLPVILCHPCWVEVAIPNRMDELARIINRKFFRGLPAVACGDNGKSVQFDYGIIQRSNPPQLSIHPSTVVQQPTYTSGAAVQGVLVGSQQGSPLQGTMGGQPNQFVPTAVAIPSENPNFKG